MNLPEDFLLLSNQIRQEITKINENLVNPKPSRYNHLIFLDICDICSKKTEEIHHITEQQFANSKGIFENKQFHKNIKSNLINVCSDCHDRIHANEISVNGYLQTSKGIILDFNKK